ncbi:MAG: site-specific recombinase, invertase Pin [Gammaproteobacteria bacterium]|jgi:site-specific DNA recombinase|nr:site-specific recombinase, invertase Pin [Gammaproteobacteria bacterium]
MEEFNRYGIDIIFLTNQPGKGPESELLLQVQGIISEYERTKIMERSRRGKLHAARKGSPCVLSRAPYGYRYIAKRDNGAVVYEIIEEEAKIVRLLFSWVGQERMSINAAANRLTEMGFRTPSEKQKHWNRGSVHRLLKNPAYKGTAAFGKTKRVSRKHRLRPYKGHPIQPKAMGSIEHTPREKWIFIPVPSIIEQTLFEAVQEQLEENKRLKRQRKTGARYLLQGLVVCNLCGYAYFGNTAMRFCKHNYYTCSGARAYPNRDRVCYNPSIRAEALEKLVWEEVKNLLYNPYCLEKEYHRRIKELEKNASKKECNKLHDEKMKIEKCIARLIDSYAEDVIEKSEFEPRVKSYRNRLFNLEQQLSELRYNQTQKLELHLLIGKLEMFVASMKQKLENVDWQMKREIFEALIKQVEICQDNINVVFKVSPYPLGSNNSPHLLEDCRGSSDERAVVGTYADCVCS